MKTRIDYIDALKGFAILLMVMGHIIAWNFKDYHIISEISHPTPTNVLYAGFLWQLIYSFHMPLFFCISGFLTHRGGGQNLKQGGQDLIKRSKRLLIPYIITGFLLLLLRGYYGYWFLFSLWQLSILGIILNLIFSRLKTNSWWIDLLIICLIWWILGKICLSYTLNQLLHPFCDFGKCYNYSIPFLFGYYMKKHEQLLTFLKNKFEHLLLFFIILFSVRYLSPNGEFLLKIHEIISIVSSYLLGICGSMLFWAYFSQFNQNSKIMILFRFLGNKTMQIYILHLFFTIQITSIGNFWLSVNFPTCLATQIAYALIMATIAIILSLATEAFLSKAKGLHSILFG